MAIDTKHCKHGGTLLFQSVPSLFPLLPLVPWGKSELTCIHPIPSPVKAGWTALQQDRGCSSISFLHFWPSNQPRFLPGNDLKITTAAGSIIIINSLQKKEVYFFSIGSIIPKWLASFLRPCTNEMNPPCKDVWAKAKRRREPAVDGQIWRPNKIKQSPEIDWDERRRDEKGGEERRRRKKVAFKAEIFAS